ncbi:hypothetical protein LCGC14_1616240 [marine sediment metagenome]|uniref:Uncharacterized protein n=1 Tax=marine sediment metagenome TaxID=412755 RepID=A0A0F9KMB6_9ZZZZ
MKSHYKVILTISVDIYADSKKALTVSDLLNLAKEKAHDEEHLMLGENISGSVEYVGAVSVFITTRKRRSEVKRILEAVTEIAELDFCFYRSAMQVYVKIEFEDGNCYWDFNHHADHGCLFKCLGSEGMLIIDEIKAQSIGQGWTDLSSKIGYAISNHLEHLLPDTAHAGEGTIWEGNVRFRVIE